MELDIKTIAKDIIVGEGNGDYIAGCKLIYYEIRMLARPVRMHFGEAASKQILAEIDRMVSICARVHEWED